MAKSIIFIFGVLVCALTLFSSMGAQTTQITYQGQLANGAVQANGSYDFEFLLFDAMSSGSQLGVTVTRPAVNVVNGSFSVALDFGANFPGAPRFLEIHVRSAGGGVFTPLAPRQPIASVPYSIKSIDAATAADSQSLGGVAASGYLQSNSAVLNQTTQQAGANFNVSGNGTAAGTLSGGTVNSVLQFNIGGNRLIATPGPLGNTVVGLDSGTALSSGSENSFFGYQAGKATTTGGENSFFGNSAGRANTTGVGGSFFGKNAGTLNSVGLYNSFFGDYAGSSNVSGGQNTFVGVQAGSNNSIGSNNTFIGLDAGSFNTTGSSNTVIGYLADMGQANLNNASAIGTRARVYADNTMILGSIAGIAGATANTRVGVGISIPNAALHVKSPDTAISAEGNLTDGIGIVGTGRVGILAIGQPNGPALRVQGTSWFQGDTSPLGTIAVNAGTGLAIGSGGPLSYIQSFDYHAFQARILAINNSGGFVGINTTTPDQQLTVNGGASKPGGGSWLSFSDARLKNIKGRYTPGLNAVMSLRPLVYEYKSENALGIKSEGDHIGFSAQEVEKVIPEAVTKDQHGYRLVNNDPIIMAMLNAIKEQQVEIEKLRHQTALQRVQINRLAKRRYRVHGRN